MTPFKKLQEMVEKRVEEKVGPIVSKMDEVLKEQKRTNELLEEILKCLKK